MVYIVKRRVDKKLATGKQKGFFYYYLCSGKREGEKVMLKNIGYIGSELDRDKIKKLIEENNLDISASELIQKYKAGKRRKK